MADAMEPLTRFEVEHLRLLWIIYRQPQGLTARQLVEELKSRGWCEPGTTAEDLGLHPDDIVRRPHMAANDP